MPTSANGCAFFFNINFFNIFNFLLRECKVRFVGMSNNFTSEFLGKSKQIYLIYSNVCLCGFLLLRESRLPMCRARSICI